MEIQTLNGKWYEKVSKHTNEIVGNITKTKPTIDKDIYKRYIYNTCIECKFDNDDLKNAKDEYSAIFFNVLCAGVEKKLKDKLDNYRIVIGRSVFTTTNLQYNYVGYDKKLAFSIFLFKIQDRIEDNNISKKEQRILDENAKIHNKKQLIDTFVIPYIQSILDKHDLKLTMCGMLSPEEMPKANISFKSQDALVNFILTHILDEINADCKQLGIELVPNTESKTYLVENTPFFNLYESKLLLDKQE